MVRKLERRGHMREARRRGRKMTKNGQLIIDRDWRNPEKRITHNINIGRELREFFLKPILFTIVTKSKKKYT
jgi:hypothetical protein